MLISRNSLVSSCLWIIALSANFTIHNLFVVPPAVILFLLGLVGLGLFASKVVLDRTIFIPSLIAALFLVIQPFLGASIAGLLGAVLAILYYPIIVSFGFSLTKENLEKISLVFIKSGVVVLSSETIWRLLHPDLRYRQFLRIDDTRWIYMFKMNSFMYSDSNITGLHLIVLIFTLFYLKFILKKNFFFLQFTLIGLLVLTFSRAAWIAFLVGMIFIFFIRRRGYLARFIVLVASFIALTAIYWFYLRPIIIGDFSFRAKYNMIDLVMFYFSKAGIVDLLVGVGFTNSIRELGIYAHNIFLVYFMETGIIGLMLWIILQVHLITSSKFSVLILMVPFFVATLSASATFMPYLYTAVALIYLWNRGNERIVKHD
ncbi:MAG: O-antigen ligase family protein [Bacteroidetes bacterium]|nr:O-antigen ligase family protein [Bacteroidota bacterium]